MADRVLIVEDNCVIRGSYEQYFSVFIDRAHILSAGQSDAAIKFLQDDKNREIKLIVLDNNLGGGDSGKAVLEHLVKTQRDDVYVIGNSSHPFPHGRINWDCGKDDFAPFLNAVAKAGVQGLQPFLDSVCEKASADTGPDRGLFSVPGQFPKSEF